MPDADRPPTLAEAQASPSSDVRPPFRLRSLGLSVYVPTFLFAVGQGAIIPTIPQFADSLGASVAMAAMIVGLRGVGTMLFDIPAGVLVGKFGDRYAMVIGTFALAVVAIGASFSRSPLVFAVLVFVMGCAWSIWLLARLSYVTEQAPVEVRGRALSLLGGANRIGNFVGPILGGYIALAVGLEYVFWLQAGMAVAASAMMFMLLSPSEDAREIHDSSIYSRVATVVVDHRRTFVTAGSAVICLQVMRNARQVVVPLWGLQVGLDAAQIGLVMGLSSGIDMLLFYPVGSVMDRFGRKWVGVPSLVVLAISMALIPVSNSFTTLMLVGLVAGLGNGLGAGIVMTLGADFSPARGRGEFLGVWRLIGDIGTAGGPFVVGGLAAVLSLGAASVATGGVGLLGAAIMYLFVAEPLRRRTPVEPLARAEGGAAR
ncbi:MAG: MFS transporter [Dehalococcoidia bacterium]|nr:MFS transporter [Dehalococcoidia bacterium]